MPVPPTIPNCSPPYRLVVLGEAPGFHEEREGAVWVGPAGRLMREMLRSAEINVADVVLANVFENKPPDTKSKSNDLGEWCQPRRANKEWLKTHETEYGDWLLSPISGGNYVNPDICLPALARLHDWLCLWRPNCILALGNTALWAMTGNANITKRRGCTTKAALWNCKVVPSFHPAMLLYNKRESGGSQRWSHRLTGIMDMMKAKRESTYPELRYPHRTFYIAPTPSELEELDKKYDWSRTVIDIETGGNIIQCIGLSPCPDVALILPFTGSGWLTCINFVRKIFTDPSIELTFQNGCYDVQWLERELKCKVSNYKWDTMILHHALQPELLKDLGFLGSVYTNERAWKHERPRAQKTKRDE